LRSLYIQLWEASGLKSKILTTQSLMPSSISDWWIPMFITLYCFRGSV
jgi:hypothetical protein